MKARMFICLAAVFAVLYLPAISSAQPPAFAADLDGYSDMGLAGLSDYYDDVSFFLDNGDSLNVRRVGRWPYGPAYTVAVRGTTAYLGSGCVVYILNISDPTTPTKVAEIATPAVVWSLFIHNTELYVTQRLYGLMIIDVTDPANPDLVGSYDTPGDALEVFLQDSLAYVADGSALMIIDVTDPANPNLVGSCDTPGNAMGIYVQDSLAYVADSDAGLTVINVADPNNPKCEEAHTCGIPGSAYRVHVEDTLAYVIDSYSALRIFNVAGPDTCYEVGYCTGCVHTTGRDVYVQDTLAYVGDHNDLVIINVADPTNPYEVGRCPTPSAPTDVFVLDTLAYIGDGCGGLMIINVADPTNPQCDFGHFDTPCTAYDVHVQNTLAYVANGPGGLRIIDVSNPANPYERSYCDTPGQALGVYLMNSLAYVADHDSGLRVINVADPDSCYEVGNYDTPDQAWGIYVLDTLAYVANGSAGLRVIDVADPNNPDSVCASPTLGYAYDVYVLDSLVYVADGSAGLTVINNGCNLVDNCPTPGDARGVYVQDSLAYVANGSAYLTIINVADPNNCYEVDSYNTPGEARDVHVLGSLAYVACGSAGLIVINVADPDSCYEVGYYNTPGYYAYGVYVSGSLVYIADGNAGLIVLEFEEAACASPIMKSIRDVPNDQGRQGRVSWYASDCDAPGSMVTITGYSLWRRIDILSVTMDGKQGSTTGVPLRSSYPPGDWEYVLTVPARGEEVYTCVAPTLCDSTVADGMCWSVFFVSAMTPDPLVYFDSAPDSGYSVDNLAPAVPKGLMATLYADSTVLSWRPNSEEDLAYYGIYRGSCPDFDPDTPFDYTADTAYTDLATDSCYKVSAFDFAGNESPLGGPVSVRDGETQPELPKVFSLSQNHPNPFNPITQIRYALPVDCRVKLEIYNTLGQKVATLVDRQQKAGYKFARWDATSLSSGIYFYRLQAGDFVQTRKMLVLK